MADENMFAAATATANSCRSGNGGEEGAAGGRVLHWRWTAAEATSSRRTRPSLVTGDRGRMTTLSRWLYMRLTQANPPMPMLLPDVEAVAPAVDEAARKDPNLVHRSTHASGPLFAC